MSWTAMMDRRWFPWLLVLAWAVAYLPYLGTRDLRLEEGRRATPAREMLDTGQWAKPTLYGDTYLNKPPMFYWVVALFSLPFGEVSPLTVRLPSALSALGCALVAWRFAPLDLDRRTRHLAALLALASSTLLDKGTLGEIDPFLCLLIALSLKCWWDGYRAGHVWRGWLAVGVLMGMAILVKGPSGPIAFYGTVGPFLLLTKQLRQLIARGHVVALVLMVLPVSGWLVALLRHPDIPNLLAVWSHQLGIDSVQSDLRDPANNITNIINHYLEFPVQLVWMFFPASLWLLVALTWRTHFAPSANRVRLFVFCGSFFPTLLYYVYPESRPRHTMASFFCIALLAASLITQWPTLSANSQRWFTRMRITLAHLPLLLGVAIWGVYGASSWATLPQAMIVSVGCLLVHAGWARLNRGEQGTNVSLPLVMVLCFNSLLLWGLVNMIVFPKMGERAATRFATQAVAGQWSPHETVYTTLTFGNSLASYYNMQFHLARHLDGVELKELRTLAPCIAFVTPQEHAELERDGLRVELIANIQGHGGPPEMHVLRIHGPTP